MRKLPLNTPTPAHSALGVVGTGVEHDSAWLHTSGQARYIDDLPAPEGLLHAAVAATLHLLTAAVASVVGPRESRSQQRGPRTQ